MIAIVSDTHIPSRASAIPDGFRDRVRRADHVVHAGDFDSSAALADLEGLAAELTAVRGNTDPDLGLPRTTTVGFDGVRVAVTHGTGSPSGYERRLADVGREEDADVVVGGHTHELLNETREGLQLLNPGSATGSWPADVATMMTATPADGRLDVETYESWE